MARRFSSTETTTCNVSFAETVTLAEELRKRHVVFEQLVLPDEIHGFLRYESWLQVFAPRQTSSTVT